MQWMSSRVSNLEVRVSNAGRALAKLREELVALGKGLKVASSRINELSEFLDEVAKEVNAINASLSNRVLELGEAKGA